MTEIEKQKFLDHWMTDFGETLQELRADIQRLSNRLTRATDPHNDRRSPNFGLTDYDVPSRQVGKILQLSDKSWPRVLYLILAATCP